jgi:hypothetical protein
VDVTRLAEGDGVDDTDDVATVVAAGTFVAENVLHPEITGKVIVFLPPDE